MHVEGVCMARGTCMAREHGGMHGKGACMIGVYVAGGVCSRRDGHCSGWYASYWNAFLFARYICEIYVPLYELCEAT